MRDDICSNNKLPQGPPTYIPVNVIEFNFESIPRSCYCIFGIKRSIWVPVGEKVPCNMELVELMELSVTRWKVGKKSENEDILAEARLVGRGGLCLLTDVSFPFSRLEDPVSERESQRAWLSNKCSPFDSFPSRGFEYKLLLSRPLSLISIQLTISSFNFLNNQIFLRAEQAQPLNAPSASTPWRMHGLWSVNTSSVQTAWRLP